MLLRREQRWEKIYCNCNTGSILTIQYNILCIVIVAGVLLQPILVLLGKVPTILLMSVIVTTVVYLVTIMLKRTGTGTKQRSDDRTTNLSRLIIIGNLRIDLFSVWLRCVRKICGGKTSN